MSREAVLFIQELTLVIALMGLVAGAFYLIGRRLPFGPFALPMLLLINVALFLGERVLAKVVVSGPILSVATVNQWSMLIQSSIRWSIYSYATVRSFTNGSPTT